MTPEQAIAEIRKYAVKRHVSINHCVSKYPWRKKTVEEYTVFVGRSVCESAHTLEKAVAKAIDKLRAGSPVTAFDLDDPRR